MRHLKTVSYAITALGIVCVTAVLLLDLNPTVLLIGLMLIIAGAVKVTMVALWHTVAGFGAPVVADDPAGSSRRRRSIPHRKEGL